ncbi:glycosyltransferase [Dyadobacter psychrophilus]|uniref:Glycosyltransferase involved in cell wall bisynthesis n=1 Tax=Dyadobacter psychrophilus TaxID=651661 RepID=A0A1T5DM19_9BACT|nr:glycosyltransferase [Dyadobacter psychrophilus]SKB72513.1 Glycosyltransferase involved in cell wall bisynthesis [Dyadobacter psychrophilus]
MDIVITGQQAWDVEIGSNCKNIALEFSKHHRVLYVNSPLDRASSYKNSSDPKVLKRREIIKNKRDGLEKIQENLWVLYPDELIESINWISSDKIFSFFNKRNNRIFADCIQREVAGLGFKDIIHFNDNDMFRSFYLKEMLEPKLSVYYSRDYMRAVDYWKKHGDLLEPELIAKSDLCVANSTYLADYCRKFNPNSHYVGQGCDLDIFLEGSKASEPADLSHLRRPRIGYVGALQSIRLDMDLLQYIAEKRPEWNIVLVGPEDNEFLTSTLHQMPNVIFTGSRDISELPAYINSFDICLNPQLLNEVTIGNYPRKIDEYLAVGKPTVATSTDAMSVFSEHVYLAKTKEDYITLIERALLENSEARIAARRTFASSHTWENSVREIYKAMGLSSSDRKNYHYSNFS